MISWRGVPLELAVGLAVLSAVWQVGLLTACTAAWLALWRRHPPRARHAVCLVSLVACLAWPLATLVMLAPAAVLPTPEARGLPGLDDALVVGSRLSLHGLPGLAVVWILGTAWAAVRVLRGRVRARRLAASAQVCDRGPLWSRFARLRNGTRATRETALLHHDGLDVPVVVGTRRPVVVWPTGLEHRLRADQVEGLLAHELAHVARRDPWWLVVAELVAVLGWFHPGVWWLTRRLHIERECCCDDWAAAQTRAPRTLAEALVGLEDRRPSWSTLSAARHPLCERVERLLASPTAGRSRPLGVLAVLAPVVLTAGLATRWEVDFPRMVTVLPDVDVRAVRDALRQSGSLARVRRASPSEAFAHLTHKARWLRGRLDHEPDRARELEAVQRALDTLPAPPH